MIIPFCYAQKPDSYEFVGVLMTANTQAMSFKVIVNEIKDGAFKGYSITDYEGKDYTKSAIEGELNLSDKKMSFKEVGNLETISTENEENFCYISASNLVIETSKKKNTIKGKFEGLFPSGKSCASGVILLVNKDDLKGLKTTFPKPMVTNVPTKDSMVLTVIDNLAEEDTIQVAGASQGIALEDVKTNILEDSLTLTSNEKLMINQWGNDASIILWDGERQDYDAVSVYLNGKLIRERIILKRTAAVVSLPTEDSVFQLKIIALNEGLSGLNTLNFRLENVGNEQDYVSILKTGESFIIDFNKDDILYKKKI